MQRGDESALAPIGRAFLEVVRERWPELLDRASVSVEGDLVIEVASPHSLNGPALWVSADALGNEIIIGLDVAHSHGGPWRADGDADHHFASSIAFLEAIFCERVVAYTTRSGGGMADLELLRKKPHGGGAISIRSWKGTHDWP